MIKSITMAALAMGGMLAFTAAPTLAMPVAGVSGVQGESVMPQHIQFGYRDGFHRHHGFGRGYGYGRPFGDHRRGYGFHGRDGYGYGGRFGHRYGYHRGYRY